jgi:hypothetical protein
MMAISKYGKGYTVGKPKALIFKPQLSPVQFDNQETLVNDIIFLYPFFLPNQYWRYIPHFQINLIFS